MAALSTVQLCIEPHVPLCPISHEIRDCEVVWAIKDETIGTTFFDEGAARFFLRSAVVKGQDGRVEEDKPKVAVEGQGGRMDDKGEMAPLKRMQYMLDPSGATSLVIVHTSSLIQLWPCMRQRSYPDVLYANVPQFPHPHPYPSRAADEVTSPLLGHYVCGAGTDGGGPKGSALGPDWSSQLELKAGSVSVSDKSH